MSMGDAFPKRCVSPNLRTVEGAWLGAGAADATKVSGHGILSVDQTATGIYTVTFVNVGAQIRHACLQVHTAATVAPQTAKMNLATFSTSAKTVEIEVWEDDAVTGVPALADLAAATTLHICVDFSDNDQ